ncbi:hypothetical protein Hypma_006229 [Hypsizygus marmoreus]|uniref:Uncharacterized protein n=1 Tax=Hypsizygus marmoreus TaxID=39966 RepID=A0A369JX97_HYPMA|nr:hypothetical protein Hypma_006229 [Hypsizygus marmoreus]
MAAIAPINQLPLEILLEIFTVAMQSDDGSRRSESADGILSLSPNPHADPEVFAQVCQWWREIATSATSLWTTIHIYKPQPQHLPKIALWFGRSGAHGLSITVTQPVQGYQKTQRPTQDALALLVTQAHRWQSIHFSLFGYDHQALSGMSLGDLPILESASVFLGTWDQINADRFWSVVHASPALRRANWGRSYSTMPTHVPWAQLTHLGFGCTLSLDSLLQFLELCPKVVELNVAALTSPVWPLPDLRSQPPLLLQHLRTMSFLRDPAEPLLDRLTLPSLKSLNIVHPSHRIPDSCQSFCDLLQRSSCQLEVLAIRDEYATSGDLLRYLQQPQLASLVKLVLHAPITDEVIVSLTHGERLERTGGCLLPRLQVIELEYAYKSRFSDRVLPDMVASRMVRSDTVITPLQIVKVKVQPSHSVDDLTSLRQLGDRHEHLTVNAVQLATSIGFGRVMGIIGGRND